MSIYIDRTPGIIAVVPTPAEAASLRDAARATSDGSNRAEAAIATATAFGAPDDPAVLELSQQAVDLARRAGDATLESAALDQLCVVHLARKDLPEAVRMIHERDQVIRTLAVDAGTGFEHSDFHLMASEVYLAAGDLIAARRHADALARLSFFRGDDHLALSRRIKVDALAGHFDDVVSSGERFRLGWERAGRPIVRNLAPSAHAVAMVHGMLGNDEHRVEWLDITVALGVSPQLLAGCTTGWAPTFDALLALHRNEPSTAVQRLAVDLDDPTVFGVWHTGLWRPWYAALWAEAAVLDHHPDAAARIEHSRNAVRANPIATTIVDRAIAIADGDHHAVEQCGPIFAELDCEYQHRRTHTLTPTVH